MIAVAGLRRYGYEKEADRIASKFLSLILKEFIAHNAILEKYDVMRRRSQVSGDIKFGYSSNEIGFGWTNAAFVDLYAALGQRGREMVLKLSVSRPEPSRKPTPGPGSGPDVRAASALLTVHIPFDELLPFFAALHQDDPIELLPVFDSESLGLIDIGELLPPAFGPRKRLFAVR